MKIKIITNLKGIITPTTQLPFGQLSIQEDCAIIVEADTIKNIIPKSQLNIGMENSEIIDGKGCWALPGYVDPHTHPVFHKTRESEFEMRIKGKSYEEIARMGGGIRNSVRDFRKASFEELTEITYHRIQEFLYYGTTTIEAKSGYGLSLKDELRSLRILRKVSKITPITIVPTFLGAHEIPDEFQNKRELYVDLIIEEMIPAVAEENLAEFCDVFTEAHVFTIQESERILEAAKQYGLRPKIHADELSYSGGAELAAKVKAISADHLLMVSDQGISAMKKSGVIPVLLPGTAFFLGQNRYAPARKLIDIGLPVALATDYNPGSSFTQNMNLILSIACTQMRMLPAEVLWASTLNSARAINRENEYGSLEINKKADITLMNIPNYQYIPYHYGMNHVSAVIKHGKTVYQREQY
jgi:imidazolonepropionase